MPPAHVDVAVVGGGPVGLALALALQDGPYDVALLEAGMAFGRRDPRAIALSHGSRLILERLEVWQGLAPRVTPIEAIHVSRQGGMGQVVLTAREVQVPALGYTVEYGDLYAALASMLSGGRVRVLAGARVEAVRPAAGCGLVSYEMEGGKHGLTARLIALADGGRSLPGPRLVKDYGASAIVCTVHTSRPHLHLAYERFTPEGPIALLPLHEAYALVWTTPAERLEERLALPDAAFIARLQAAFGERQGRFTAAGPRAAFPLRLVSARRVWQQGLVRIGNAAQTLHPVAGQGLNLGLRDVWTLAETLLETPRHELGSAACLDRYHGRRRWDVGGGILMTDLLAEAFTGRLSLLGPVRDLALGLMDALPMLRRMFARKMMFGGEAW